MIGELVTKWLEQHGLEQGDPRFDEFHDRAVRQLMNDQACHSLPDALPRAGVDPFELLNAEAVARSMAESQSVACTLALLDLAELVQKHVAREASNSNLRPRQSRVTDEQILAVVNDARYRTRPEQAERLGMDPRELRRRIKRLKDVGLIGR